MEPISPRTRVPDDWIHPALKKQLADRGHLGSTHKECIELLEQQHTNMEDATVRRQKLLEEKIRQLEEIDRHRQSMAEEIKEGEKQLVNLRYVHDRLGEQLIMQKTIGKQDFFGFSGVDDLQAFSCVFGVGGINTWGRVMSCFAADDETRYRFFTRYAPLFTTIGDEPMTARRVTEPVFFDEMCLVETEGRRCINPACPYWHRNQLEHVKLGCMELFTRAAMCIKGHSSICDAASVFASFYASIEATTDLVDAVRLQRDLLNCIADFGWAAALLGEEPSSTWGAPLLPPPNLPLQHVASLLRDSKEHTLWGHILQAKSDPVVAATALFRQHTDSLSWRCLMRVAGTTTDRLLWLATRGIALFPTSPFIRLSYLSVLLKSGCAVPDCVEACLSSAQLLSDQAAIATYSHQDTQWCEMTARYIAYMVAMVCVHVAGADPEAAAGLLKEVVELPGRICLLPLALQNLTLFLVVLRQTKRLEGVEVLPLASISDVAFTLGECFPHRSQEECGRLLSRQLSLLNLCASEGMDTTLTEYMRSHVHLSLIHAFSADTQLVDKILIMSPVHSALGLTEIWVEYLRFVGRRDGAEPLISLVHTLLASCHSPLLVVRLVRFLQLHDESVETVIDIFLEKFATQRGISLENVPQLAMGHSPGIPAEEWIPFIILYSLRLRLQERLELLLGVPLDLFCEMVELVVLLWLETLQVALLLRDDNVFRHCTRQGLLLLREPFLHQFSAVDWGFDDMVSYAHLATLMVYRAVPIFLGTAHELTAHYRGIVLEVGAELHVVHPFLLSAE
ncbi:hypothetical protein TRSC58_05847 [Trypanosoma rangeli SC58]|uniref:Uncharacterized protein n=1 Tax=Trypanosoma rangeli SC58 TaxID=429131 RepID=A0A061IUZ8_TRYRA|nr:hypothetical protein TRSC58_05847 [Trypanosoma rangeli SC58]